MADDQQDGINIDAIVHAVEDNPKPEIALDRIAQAVAAPEKPARKGKGRSGFKSPAEVEPSLPASPVEPVSNIEQSTSEEIIMADETIINDTTDTTTQTATGFAGTMQDRMQSFYNRSTGVASEMTDLGRGNVEAVVESTRVLTTGLQDMSRTTLEETRTAFETMTADMKRMAGVTSPTELLQVQSEVARRNLDAFITHSSKNAETMLKLANDVFAPVASRMSVAAEKLTKVA